MGFLDEATSKAKDMGSQVVDSVKQAAGFGDKSQSVKGAGLYDANSAAIISSFKLSQDLLMFQFPQLLASDSFKKYDYEFAIYDMVKGQKIMSFVLPLPPQSINISVPAAINTTVTMKGIVEEHNGAPLRQISISGSTGVYPIAVSNSNESNLGSGKKGPLDYLFQNTIQAAQSTLSSAKQTLTSALKVASAFTGEAQHLDSPVLDPFSTWIKGGQTGYIIAHNLMRFMDLYLELKKAGNKNLTLMFLMHKDSMYYNCSLSNLSVRKGAGTLEYLYSISLIAWQRYPQLPKGSDQPVNPGAYKSGHNQKSINPFAQINRTLDQGIATINKGLSVLQGFQADLNTAVLQPLKKVRILAKTVSNIPKTITDYSDVIIRSAEAQIKETFANLSHDQSQSRTAEQIRQRMKTRNSHVYGGEPQRDGKATTSPFDTSANQQDNTRSGPNSPRQQTALTGGLEVDPFGDMFANPAEYDDILSVATISTLQLNTATQELIAQEEQNAALLTSEDIQIIKYSLDSFTALLSQRIGGNSPVYDQIFGLASPTYTKALTTEDIEILSVMNDMSMALDQMIVLIRSQKNTTDEDYSRWYGTYARTQGIDFVESNSKFYVPFPLGASLESLSNTYLGDVNRWIEIAAINGLKEPYVDEIGFFVPFRSTGSGNSFLITSPEGLYIGQPILVQSITQRPEPRRIDAIKVISSIQTLITVNGDADLSKFTVTDQAKLHAYKPNTVNSYMMIAIPSQNAPEVPSNMSINPSEKDMQNITYLALSDFALNFDTSQGTADIQLVGSDVAVARSYANLTQAAFIKLYTHQGDLLDDPLFGNPVQVGSSVADFNPSTALNELAVLFAQDNRFSGLKAGRVLTKGGSVNIELLLGIASTGTYMPIKTTVPTR